MVGMACRPHRAGMGAERSRSRRGRSALARLFDAGVHGNTARSCVLKVSVRTALSRRGVHGAASAPSRDDIHCAERPSSTTSDLGAGAVRGSPLTRALSRQGRSDLLAADELELGLAESRSARGKVAHGLDAPSSRIMSASSAAPGNALAGAAQLARARTMEAHGTRVERVHRAGDHRAPRRRRIQDPSAFRRQARGPSQARRASASATVRRRRARWRPPGHQQRLQDAGHPRRRLRPGHSTVSGGRAVGPLLRSCSQSSSSSPLPRTSLAAETAHAEVSARRRQLPSRRQVPRPGRR